MVGYLKYSENSEDRELALQKPKKEMGGPLWQRCPDPAQWGWPTDGPRWATTHTDGDAHDHMTVAKTQTLSG